MRIFNFFKKKQSVPEWANFFNHNQYDKFIKYLINYFNNNLEINHEEGVIKIKSDNSFYGLSNVAHFCEQNKSIYWEKIIQEHFDKLLDSKKFAEEFSKYSDQFDYVKPYIATRVYSLEYLENVGLENVVYKKITDDLYQTLVYDFPHTIHTVKKEEISAWNKTTEELLSIGLFNLKNKYEKEIVHQDMGEFYLWLIADNEGFSTNVLLDKEELDKHLGSKGGLIGAPNGNITFIYAIETIEVISVVHTMVKMIKGEFNKPKAMSNKLYWYIESQMIEIPFSFSGKEIKVKPPQSFVNMLNNLSEIK